MTVNDLYWPPEGISVISCVHPNVAQIIIKFLKMSTKEKVFPSAGLMQVV